MLAEIVRVAQRHLSEHPYDTLHSVSHHQQVWENCQWIIREEGLDRIDVEALEIAAWWHDVERKSETHDLLREALKNRGVTDTFIEKVVGIINGHSFGKGQHSLEAEVLYDADKLEYLSIQRLEALINGFQNGAMDKARFEYYSKAWAERIVGVRTKIHFESARRKFQEKFASFIAYAKSQPLLASMVVAVL